MGSAVFTGITVTAAVVTAIVFDHFALMGFKHHPAWVLRVAGATLIAGL
jgi:bacterial/archaeal transporter family-2 protein